MFPTHLTTNEVKDRTGAEVECSRIDPIAGRGLRFQSSASLGTAYPLIVSVNHDTAGSGLKLIRRSVLRVDKTRLSQVDGVTPITISVYTVAVIPLGHLTDQNTVADVIAHNNSLMASKGASTTILYDGTGYGAAALIEGSN